LKLGYFKKDYSILNKTGTLITDSYLQGNKNFLILLLLFFLNSATLTLLAQKTDSFSIPDNFTTPAELSLYFSKQMSEPENDSFEMKVKILDEAIKSARLHNFLTAAANFYYDKGLLLYRAHKYKESKQSYLAAKQIYLKFNDLVNVRRTFEEIGYCYERLGLADSASNYYEANLKISKNIKNDSTLALAYSNLGHAAWRKGNFSSALENYTNALKIRKQLNLYEDIASSLNSIGSVYWKRGNYGKSLDYFFQSLKIRKNIKEYFGMITVLNNIGSVYQKLKYYNKAKEYFLSASQLSDSSGYKFGQSYSSYNLGLLDLELGGAESAIKHLDKSIKISTIISELNLLAIAKISLGKCYEKNENLKLAEKYYTEAINESEKHSDSFALASAGNNLAKILIKNNGSKNEILPLLNRSLSICQNENLKELLKDNYEAFYLLYKRENDIRNEQNYFRKFVEVKDSLFNEKLVNDMTNLIVRFEIEKTEGENYLLRKDKQLQQAEIEAERTLRNLILVIAVLCLSLLIVIFYLYSHKTKLNSQINSQKLAVETLNKELIERNAELDSINRTKDKFFSIISHDIKNPAGVINNFSVLLIKNYDNLTNDEVQKIIQSIKNSSDTLIHLIFNLLDWSRSQLDKIEPNIIKILVGDVLDEVYRLYESNAELKNISLEIEKENNCSVMADPQMINSVLRNLLSNAIKFTHPGGIIKISVKSADKYCKISIIDNGIGMEEETLNDLFKRDIMISMHGTASEKGTGMGLMLCKEFVSLNGGEIGVTSKINEGSTFWFTLPSA
jgi:signal transduction histidine kinase/Tfp pilus assembly protein PilF